MPLFWPFIAHFAPCRPNAAMMARENLQKRGLTQSRPAMSRRSATGDPLPVGNDWLANPTVPHDIIQEAVSHPSFPLTFLL